MIGAKCSLLGNQLELDVEEAVGTAQLLGCFISTASRNVPLNQALATMDSSSSETHRYWREVYRPRWTTWNSVRTVACLGASALVIFALVWPI